MIHGTARIQCEIGCNERRDDGCGIGMMRAKEKVHIECWMTRRGCERLNP